MTNQHVLILDRVLDAPVAKVWRCWAEPELFAQWFLPKPWQISDAKLDLRNGGEISCVMNGPNGERHEYTGVFLDVMSETALITPPVGLNLFVIQAVGKAKLSEVVRGALPFAVIMLCTAVLMWFWQDLALFVPSFFLRYRL